MITLLIALYVLAANAIVVPDGCFVAVWILAVISTIAKAVGLIVRSCDKS